MVFSILALLQRVSSETWKLYSLTVLHVSLLRFLLHGTINRTEHLSFLLVTSQNSYHSCFLSLPSLGTVAPYRMSSFWLKACELSTLWPIFILSHMKNKNKCEKLPTHSYIMKLTLDICSKNCSISQLLLKP